jgi:hypothetical protein
MNIKQLYHQSASALEMTTSVSSRSGGRHYGPGGTAGKSASASASASASESASESASSASPRPAQGRRTDCLPLAVTSCGGWARAKIERIRREPSTAPHPLRAAGGVQQGASDPLLVVHGSGSDGGGGCTSPTSHSPLRHPIGPSLTHVPRVFFWESFHAKQKPLWTSRRRDYLRPPSSFRR